VPTVQKFWKPQLPGALKACPGLSWDSFIFLLLLLLLILQALQSWMNLSFFQKLSSTVLGPVTYVFSFSSLELPHLTQTTSIFTFLQEINIFNGTLKTKEGKNSTFFVNPHTNLQEHY
jgi:hypothetical protein